MNIRIIIAILMFFSILTIGQEDNSDASRKYPAVEVKLSAVVALTESEGEDLDKNLILTISKIKALNTINYSYSAHIKAHELKTVFLFSDMEQFFKWYETEEAKGLFKDLEAKFKKYSLEINYRKAAEL
ncbi:MAG: hypothetical protein R3250_11600 [Melioribacteraceae bacterium]|nr:hypothetical protein [Melioribacteraceae bacterium]